MAGQIFIEANEVEVAGLPSGAMHLYLVFRERNGEEHVIRSGPENRFLPWFGEMKIEANVPIEDSADDRGSETPAERSSTPLDFAGLTDDEAWAIMVKYALMLRTADYPYEVFDENSNAFVGAMLASAGGDPLTMLPQGVTRSEALGISNHRNILTDVPPPKDGTIRGTAGADRIAGLQIDDVIRASGGSDAVRGGRGNDRIHGGAGNDRLYGQAGHDLLRGGSGADLLDGGRGRNTLIGGTNADDFQFAQTSTTLIRDFEDGIDRIRIEDDVAVRFEDIAITSFGTSRQHTRIAHEDIVIELFNIRRGLLDAGDMDLMMT